MSFRVQLASDSYSVEPGVAAPVSLELTNESSATQKFEIQVEGIDPEWVAIPLPILEIAGNETATERFFLKPPREPESISGTYPFVVKITGEGGTVRQVTCSLEIKPFHNVSIDIQPRRGVVSPLSRETIMNATVMNLGNVEHTVKLHASDAEDQFAFSFDHEEVTVAPGAQKSVSMSVTAVKPSMVANARLQQVTVSARSLDGKMIATATHAQIEQRPLLTPAVLWVAILLVFILTSFVLLLPKPPVVDAITITPDRVYVGDSFTVEWSASHARSVELVVNGVTYSDLSPNGRKTVLTSDWTDIDLVGKQISIEVTALSGTRRSPTLERQLFVRQKEIPPDPEIFDFSVTPAKLKVGESYIVQYKLSKSVTSATLSPTGLELDLKKDAVTLTAIVEGEFDFVLHAENSAGQVAEKSVHVVIERGSKASIVVFRAEPAIVDPIDGRVTLTWQTNNALRRELVINNGRPQQLDEDQGQMDVLITSPTTFKLIVWDDQGYQAEKEVTVKTRIIDEFP